MSIQLEKALSLCKKTGDRIIVFDSPRSENPFVLMNLDDYEELLSDKNEVSGLTEDQLLDKINRDIALWKTEQEPEESTDLPQDLGLNAKESITANPQAGDNPVRRSQWAIKEEVKEAAEEVIEEDRQYLETVTY
ncbi:hypothetical protein HGA64_01845 [Candidatus Falkowbacteria bacterium]|nr:hypothetical protein [Candidatus Falkowbacteria bacterium]